MPTFAANRWSFLNVLITESSMPVTYRMSTKMISGSSSVPSVISAKAAVISSTVPQNRYASRYSTMMRWPCNCKRLNSLARRYFGACLVSALSTALTTEAFMDKRMKFRATSAKPTPAAVLRSLMSAARTHTQAMTLLPKSKPFRLSQRNVRASPKPTCRKQPPRKKHGIQAPSGTLDKNTTSQRPAAVHGAKRRVPPSFFIGSENAATWCPGCPPSKPTKMFALPRLMNSASRLRLFSWGALASIPAMLMIPAITHKVAATSMRSSALALNTAPISQFGTSYTVVRRVFGDHSHSTNGLSQGGCKVRRVPDLPRSSPPANTTTKKTTTGAKKQQGKTESCAALRLSFALKMGTPCNRSAATTKPKTNCVTTNNGSSCWNLPQSAGTKTHFNLAPIKIETAFRMSKTPTLPRKPHRTGYGNCNA
mmetsp:Transcript_130490/g.278812  ORF Transcript_130490/g.278812 Transcript_130490/m.278812 type:complete len:424 (-) Transcript_130490:634-1905(-)